MEELKNFIKGNIENIKERRLNPAIVEFKDTKTKYIVPKSTVMVEVALQDGLIAKIDITEYFKGVL